MVSVSDCLNAISNDKSLVLFNTIALSGGYSSILITRVELTRKKYYSRLNDIINAGLMVRKNGRYFLTSLGKIVYEAQELIGKAIHCSSKLKAIDSIQTAELPTTERTKIIDTLIDNSEIKEILLGLKRNSNYVPEIKEIMVPSHSPIH